jgi:hypothetical protein
MGTTPDRHPGPRQEEELILEDYSSDPSSAGGITYNAGALKAQDATGVFNVRTHVEPHASTHEGGSDPLTVQDLDSGAAAANLMLQTDGVGGWTLEEGVPGYPPELDFDTDLTEEGTTNSDWQEKLSMTTSSLPSGSYIVLMQATVAGTKASTKVGVKGELDDTTEIGSIIAKPGYTDGDLQFFAHAVLTSFSGVHTFDIDWKLAGGGGTAKIRGARITLWRVA